MDGTGVNLQPFMSAGGKLLMWHGSTDIAVPVQMTNEYYASVVASVGGQATADGFMRYYVAPAVNHCGGIAPGDLAANKINAAGATLLSRPLCRYPPFPKYNGSGRRECRGELHLRGLLSGAAGSCVRPSHRSFAARTIAWHALRGYFTTAPYIRFLNRFCVCMRGVGAAAMKMPTIFSLGSIVKLVPDRPPPMTSPVEPGTTAARS
jgi:Tannase and feruloyl esterase